MFLFLIFLALIFFIAGGVGLFYTHTSLAAGSPSWVHGNITYGTFTIVGLATIVFLVIFGSEIE